MIRRLLVPISSDPLKVATRARRPVDDIGAAFAATGLPTAG